MTFNWLAKQKKGIDKMNYSQHIYGSRKTKCARRNDAVDDGIDAEMAASSMLVHTRPIKLAITSYESYLVVRLKTIHRMVKHWLIWLLDNIRVQVMYLQEQ